ncbi:MAG: L,D-transpeptidase family protein [Vicinamibacterales bacterium]
MKSFATCVALAALAAATAAAPLDHLHSARQLVLVITPGWDDVRGELRRFERRATGETWRAVGAPASIVVGKNGSAWDPLVDPVVAGPVKREGDGRSPAGIFTLGTAFGYAPAPEAAWLKLPYLHVTEGIECVDDVASTSYNQIVNRRSIAAPDWTSSEKMREVGEAYRWGVVINYNASPAVTKRGSCIFLHIGGENGKGTAGCTATSPTELRTVMEWLDPKAGPAFVQLPQAAYDKIRGAWQLP